MKKNLTLLVLLLVLAAIAFGFYKKDQVKEANVKYEGNFKIENPEQITRIFMVDREGRKVDLKKKRTWMVNDVYQAREAMIINLLEVLEHVSVQFIPRQKAVERIVKEIASNAIKVEVYKKGDKAVSTFYVGGVTSDERGTYYIKEDSDQPFVMELPFFEGSLRARFVMNYKDWRSIWMLNEDADEIEKIEMKYPRMQNASFQLEKKGSHFEATPYVSMSDDNAKVNHAMTRGYIESIDQVGMQSYLETTDELLALKQETPWADFTLSRKDGTQNKILFYPTPMKANPTVREATKRYYGYLQTGEFFIIHEDMLKKLLWTYDSFLDK